MLAHRDDTLAQASARTAKSGPDGTMQRIVAAEDAVATDATRSTSSRMLGGLTEWMGMMGGALDTGEPEPAD